MKTASNFYRFFARFTGLDEATYQELTTADYRQVVTLGITMFFTATLGGCFVGAGLGTVWDSLPLGLLAGTTIWSIVYWVDRLLVSSVRPGNWQSILFRTLLIVGALLAHTVSFDLIWFDEAIERELIARHEAELEVAAAASLQLAGETRQQLVAKDAQLQELRNENQEKFNRIARESDGLIGTRRKGKGTDYEKEKKDYAAYNEIVYLPTYRQLKEEMEQLRAASAAHELAAAEIRQRPFDYAEFGPSSRLLTLKQLLFDQGRPDIFVYTLMICLLILTIELAPIFYRHFLMNFDAYVEIYTQREAARGRRTELEAHRDLNRITGEMLLDDQMKEITLSRKRKEATLRAHLAVFESFCGSVRELDQLLSRAMQEVNEEYHDLLREARDRTHDDLRRTIG